MSKNINILIVDDSKTFNNMVKALFEELEYNVYQAFDIKGSKELLETTSIDYVFLDLSLPDGNGEDMIDIIHNNYNAKVIVMTGSTDTTQRDKIFENGIVDYFIKTTPIPVIVNCANTLIKNIENHKNTNILTIDDSHFVRNILKNILKSKNYNVFEASNASDGKDIIEKNDIHLILLDLIMPGVDGMSFLETIKSNKKYYDIPIIVISGDGSRENYARVLKQGASDFIRKPFIVEEVLLKCDIHVKSYLHYKNMFEKEQEILKHETMITLQKKEIEKQKSIASLIKNIAHHWRQPLSVMSLNASSTKYDILELDSYDKEDVASKMDAIVENTKYLSKVIDDFDMLIIKDLEKKDVFTQKLIDEALVDTLDFIEQNGVKLVKKIENITFKTYYNEMLKIIETILENITEHAKDPKHIFINVNKRDKYLELSIKDDGGGVQENILGQIFEPYFTTSHQYLGKGMGLYLIFKLIKEHFHGTLEAKNVEFTYEDTPLKGFEIFIKLPI